MFDGVKIKCNDIANKLQQNDLLRFVSSLDETTGEIKPHKKAIYKSLIFSVGTLPNANNRPYANIKGSLHKYKNNGIHNADNFTFIEVCKVINDLATNFDIDPETSNLTQLEIGVNIELSIPVSKFLKMLISMPTDKFTDYKIDRVKVGKQQKATDKIIKIYDKGKLTGHEKNKTPEVKNLLRVEIHYTRIRPLQAKYDIKTLADLTDFDKVKSLYKELLSIFDNIIMYEKDFDTNKLTIKQLLKLKDYINPLYWQDLTKFQRTHHKKQYSKLLDEFSKQKYKKEVSNKIVNKWFNLIGTQQKNTLPFPKLILSKEAEKHTTISNVDKSWKRLCKPFEKIELKKSEIEPKTTPENLKIETLKKHFCLTCGNDISHQKKNSKFCSKKCSNVASNKNRQKRIIENRKTEIQNLKVLTKELQHTNYNLQIFKKTSNGIKAQRIKQSKIKPLKYQSLRKIILVKVFINRKAKILTTMRAKQLIKIIISINKKQHNENKLH